MKENPQYERVPIITIRNVRKYQLFYTDMDRILDFEYNKEGEPYNKGSVINNMQRLLTGKDKDGRQVDVPRVLATGKMLADARLNANKADRDDLRSRYIEINLAAAKDPNGSEEMAFRRESPLVLALNPETKLMNGRLPLTNEQYEEFRNEGFIFNEKEIEAFRKNPYTLPKKREEFWNYVLENQTKEYIGCVCTTLGMTFDDVMGLHISPLHKGLHLFGLLPVNYNHRSNGHVYNSLDGPNGCLLGVAKNIDLEKILF
jgi:hypothetical protein